MGNIICITMTSLASMKPVLITFLPYLNKLRYSSYRNNCSTKFINRNSPSDPWI